MGKIGSIAKWCIIRDSIIQELQEQNTVKEVTKQVPKKKPIKRKKKEN